MLRERLDTVPFLIYHSNAVCQTVAKSSLKVPRSWPTGCSFNLKASNRDACRLPLLRPQGNTSSGNTSSEKMAKGEVQQKEKAALLDLFADADKTCKSSLKGFNFSI